MVTFWTLPLISPVAAACCSTAAAIAVTRFHLADRYADLTHRADGRVGCIAYSNNLGTDLAGRAGSLGSESLYLTGNHREAFSRLSGTGRLNRRIQCQQVGLPRNV